MSNVFGFNSRDAAKLIELIDGAGGTQLTANPKLLPDDGARVYIAYLTSSVTARSGTTLGSGSATMQQLSSAGVLSNYLEVDGVTTWTVTVYNTTTNVLATNQYVQVKRENSQGLWLVDVASCA